MTEQDTTVDDQTPEGEMDTDTNQEGETQGNDERAKLFAKYKVDPSNFSEEDLLKTLKRIEKAENLTVSQKKLLKEKEKSWENQSEYITKADLALERFLDKNPDLSEYRDEFAKYQKLWLSLEKAKILIENEDTSKKNREKLGKMSVTDGESDIRKRSYTKDELASLPQKEFETTKKLIKEWKIKLVM